MKSKLATLGALLLAAGSAFGTVSINFNNEFDTGVPQGFSNAAGTPTNGLIWGIIVDGSNNGLSALSYIKPVQNVAPGAINQYILSTTLGATDDVFSFSTSGPTASTAGSTEGDSVTTGGVGGIYDITGIPLTNGVGAGDKFYVVWFDGNTFGTLTDASFVIPADGNAVALADPFVGVDPNRTSGFSYVGTSGVATGPTPGFFVVPEPSSALLGAIGALGLLRRRRN